MKTLRYKIGAELDVVIESNGFKDSIFSEQYERALHMTDRYVGNLSKALKVVAFCGERGDGKTSCMETVRGILQHSQDSDNTEYGKYVESLKLERLPKYKFECLKVVDPSFFDKSHNVVELVLGQMYLNVYKDNRAGSNALLKLFASVKRCVDNLHKSQQEKWDEMQELADIAAGVELRDKMQELVTAYLSFVGKDCLVVSIDDIDLNMEYAYDMCEHIRKYLSVDNCVILLSVKLDQLKNVVRGWLIKQNGRITNKEGFDIMARKYIEKLLPASCHVNMPKAYGLCNCKLEIVGGKDMPQSSDVKTAVVELIYRRTGYLFYNSHGGVSPIVPNNLRSLMHLIGLLVPMSNKRVNDKTLHEANKNAFKDYFYKEWTQQLSADSQIAVAQLLNEASDTAINKQTVACLGKVAEMLVTRNYEEDEDDKVPTDSDEASSFATAIVNKANFSYNISVGDVFCLINMLEKDTLPTQESLLLFFIKSFYSIRLYEAYDEITDAMNIYPENTGTGVSREDARFNHTNALQRLVGGCYFTYNPNNLMANGFDKRVINNEKLCEKIHNLHVECTKMQDKDTPDEKFKQNFRLAEFFVLTTWGFVNAKYASKLKTHQMEYRSNVTARYLMRARNESNRSRKYGMFDSLSLFANITNPKYAYSRFEDDNTSWFYDYAVSHDFTLLGQMKEKALKGRKNYKGLHGLMSDAVIRNAEVLAAMFEKVKDERGKNHKPDIEGLKGLYSNLKISNLSTHSQDNKDKQHAIEFHFIDAIEALLSDVKNNCQSEWNEIFEIEKATNDSKQKVLHTNREYHSWQDLLDAVWKSGQKPHLKTLIRNIEALQIPELENVDFPDVLRDIENNKALNKDEREEAIQKVWKKIEEKRNTSQSTKA